MNQLRFSGLMVIPLLVGCSIIEKTRIIDRTETELARTFIQTPQLLLNNSYGGLEEGGDVALLKLGEGDCSAVQKAFSQTRLIQPKTREHDTFLQAGLAPTTAHFHYWSDMDGADTTYLLDKTSCVLYRQAHFE